MTENKKLRDQEAIQVSGGSPGSNPYPKEDYHKAGFITEWTNNPFYFDSFYLRLDGRTKASERMCVPTASIYVEYYKSHTEEEYIKHVQQQFPEFTKIYKGFDIS